MVLSSQPHTEVESTSFHMMLASVNPGLDQKLLDYSADTVKRDLMKAYEAEKRRVGSIIGVSQQCRL